MQQSNTSRKLWRRKLRSASCIVGWGYYVLKQEVHAPSHVLFPVVLRCILLTMLACILLADLPFGKLTLILLVDLHVAVHFTVLTWIDVKLQFTLPCSLAFTLPTCILLWLALCFADFHVAHLHSRKLQFTLLLLCSSWSMFLNENFKSLCAPILRLAVHIPTLLIWDSLFALCCSFSIAAGTQSATQLAPP